MFTIFNNEPRQGPLRDDPEPGLGAPHLCGKVWESGARTWEAWVQGSLGAGAVALHQPRRGNFTSDLQPLILRVSLSDVEAGPPSAVVWAAVCPRPCVRSVQVSMCSPCPLLQQHECPALSSTTLDPKGPGGPVLLLLRLDPSRRSFSISCVQRGCAL